MESNSLVLGRPIRGTLFALLVYCVMLAVNVNVTTLHTSGPRPTNTQLLHEARGTILPDRPTNTKPDINSTQPLNGRNELKVNTIPHPDDQNIAQYHSEFYNITMPPGGPVLRVRHMVDATSRLSSSRAEGLGLNVAMVGVPADLQIVVNATGNTDLKDCAYSVLAIGQNIMFSGNTHESTSNKKVNFTFIPKYPGMYDLYVEEINMMSQFQIPGSPFQLLVKGSPTSAAKVRDGADQLPSCQSIDLVNPRWEDGYWVSRHYAGNERGTLRSGWVYQRETCSFDIFTKKDLALVAESQGPKRILVLGTSVDRGIFLSIVDLILTSEEKMYLDVSDVAKCWGYMDVHVGNLTVSYQDFRLVRAGSSTEKDDSIECHDDKLAEGASEVPLLNAIGFLTNMFSEEARSWPDSITLVPKDRAQFQMIMNAIPKSWNGTVVPLYNFLAINNIYTHRNVEMQYKKALSFLSVDPRVQLVDGFSIAAGMRHATESSPFVRKSSHFHRFCNELNGEMRVCGDTTEMMAQLILGKVIAPQGKHLWEKSLHGRTSNKIRPGRIVKVCHDCPKSLLPFHIKVRPQPTCYETIHGMKPCYDVNPVWDGSVCPEECLKSAPVEEIPTQSGSVKVRRCKL